MANRSRTYGHWLPVAGLLTLLQTRLPMSQSARAQDAGLPSQVIDDVGDLVAELQAQAESQREQLQRTEGRYIEPVDSETGRTVGNRPVLKEENEPDVTGKPIQGDAKEPP